MSNFKLIQILATREGGSVKRCHTLPTRRYYDVAQHSYNCVSMLLLLHPTPPIYLIQNLLWHDVAERWLGDIPAPAKWGNSNLKRQYEDNEDKILQRFELQSPVTGEDRNWIRAIDTLELYLWSREDRLLGNTNTEEMETACLNILSDMFNCETLPEPIIELMHYISDEPKMRLSDFFSRLSL